MAMESMAKLFSYKPARQLADYLATYNCESQVIAIDGSTTENIQSTGTKAAFIAGRVVALAVDTELDISADTEGTLTAWVTATAYTAGNIREGADGIRYRCILAHTSSSANEPGAGESWDTYWKYSPHGAVNAVGDTITTGYGKWYMVTAKSDGTLTVWIACDAEAATTTAVLKVPQYDPEEYVVVGFIYVNNDSGSTITIGTTSLTGDGTYYQVTGPVFPHPDNL